MLHRIISLVTAFIFLSQSLGIAGMDLVLLGSPSGEVSHLIPSIQIPRSLGEVERTVLQPGSNSFLIHIQDAHGNYEAQKNTEAILAHLKKEYGIRLLFLEGGAERLQPRRFHFFKDRKLDLEAADLLMREGKFSGAERFLLDPGGEGYGLEEAALYRENLKQFQTVIKNKDGTQKFLDELDKKVQAKRGKIFSRELKGFIKQWRDFYEQRSDWLSFLNILEKEAKTTLGLDLKDPRNQIRYPALVRFFTVKSLEGRLKQDEIEKERRDFLEFIKDKINPALYQEFVNLQEKNPRFLFERLVEALLKKGIRLPRYPQFALWVEHKILSSEIDAANLWKESELLSNKVLMRLAKTSEEKKLLCQLKRRIFLGKFLNLELTRGEWERIQCGMRNEDCGNSANSAFQNLQSAFQFYCLAEKRESAFVRNMLSVMKRKKAGRAVVITGGFHTMGLENQIKSKRISFISIRPRISQTGKSRDIYLDSMMPEKTSHLARAVTLNRPDILEKLVEPDLLRQFREDEVRVVREVASASSLGASDPQPMIDPLEKARKILALNREIRELRQKTEWGKMKGEDTEGALRRLFISLLRQRAGSGKWYQEGYQWGQWLFLAPSALFYLDRLFNELKSLWKDYPDVPPFTWFMVGALEAFPGLFNRMIAMMFQCSPDFANTVAWAIWLAQDRGAQFEWKDFHILLLARNLVRIKDPLPREYMGQFLRRYIRLHPDMLAKLKIEDHETVAQILEPLALSNPEIFDEAMREKLEHLLATTRLGILKYTLYHLLGKGRKPLPKKLSPYFPYHQEVHRILGQGPKKVLIIQNIRDGLGDEVIRNVPLMQSLLAFNPELKIVVMTERPYLYDHPRVEAHVIRKSNFSEFDTDYDMVVLHADREQRHDSFLTLMARQYLAKRPPPIYLEMNKSDDDFLYAQSRVGTRDVMVPENIRNVYAATYRMLATLGLPIEAGTDPRTESPLVKSEYPPADAWWEKNVFAVQARNGEKRPVVIFNAFGGESEQKGFARAERRFLTRILSDLIRDGFFVVLALSSSAWGNTEVAERLARDLGPSRAHLAIAPEPHEDRRLYTHLIAKSDLVISVEGGLMHQAYNIGKPLFVLYAQHSGLLKWLSFGFDALQMRVPPYALAYLSTFILNQPGVRKAVGMDESRPVRPLPKPRPGALHVPGFLKRKIQVAQTTNLTARNLLGSRSTASAGSLGSLRWVKPIDFWERIAGRINANGGVWNVVPGMFRLDKHFPLKAQPQPPRNPLWVSALKTLSFYTSLSLLSFKGEQAAQPRKNNSSKIIPITTFSLNPIFQIKSVINSPLIAKLKAVISELAIKSRLFWLNKFFILPSLCFSEGQQGIVSFGILQQLFYNIKIIFSPSSLICLLRGKRPNENELALAGSLGSPAHSDREPGERFVTPGDWSTVMANVKNLKENISVRIASGHPGLNFFSVSVHGKKAAQGSLEVRPDTGTDGRFELINITVEEEFTEQGIARSIFQWLLQEARKMFPESRFPFVIRLVFSPYMLNLAEKMFEPGSIEVFDERSRLWFPLEDYDLYGALGALKIKDKGPYENARIEVRKMDGAYRVIRKPEGVRVVLNGVKIRAVDEARGRAFRELWFDKDFSIRGIPQKSAVYSQPSARMEGRSLGLIQTDLSDPHSGESHFRILFELKGGPVIQETIPSGLGIHESGTIKTGNQGESGRVRKGIHSLTDIQGREIALLSRHDRVQVEHLVGVLDRKTAPLARHIESPVQLSLFSRGSSNPFRLLIHSRTHFVILYDQRENKLGIFDSERNYQMIYFKAGVLPEKAKGLVRIAEDSHTGDLLLVAEGPESKVMVFRFALASLPLIPVWDLETIRQETAAYLGKLLFDFGGLKNEEHLGQIRNWSRTLAESFARFEGLSWEEQIGAVFMVFEVNLAFEKIGLPERFSLPPRDRVRSVFLKHLLTQPAKAKCKEVYELSLRQIRNLDNEALRNWMSEILESMGSDVDAASLGRRVTEDFGDLAQVLDLVRYDFRQVVYSGEADQIDFASMRSKMEDFRIRFEAFWRDRPQSEEEAERIEIILRNLRDLCRDAEGSICRLTRRQMAPVPAYPHFRWRRSRKEIAQAVIRAHFGKHLRISPEIWKTLRSQIRRVHEEIPATSGMNQKRNQLFSELEAMIAQALREVWSPDRDGWREGDVAYREMIYFWELLHAFIEASAGVLKKARSPLAIPFPLPVQILAKTRDQILARRLPVEHVWHFGDSKGEPGYVLIGLVDPEKIRYSSTQHEGVFLSASGKHATRLTVNAQGLLAHLESGWKAYFLPVWAFPRDAEQHPDWVRVLVKKKEKARAKSLGASQFVVGAGLSPARPTNVALRGGAGLRPAPTQNGQHASSLGRNVASKRVQLEIITHDLSEKPRHPVIEKWVDLREFPFLVQTITGVRKTAKQRNVKLLLEAFGIPEDALVVEHGVGHFGESIPPVFHRRLLIDSDFDETKVLGDHTIAASGLIEDTDRLIKQYAVPLGWPRKPSAIVWHNFWEFFKVYVNDHYRLKPWETQSDVLWQDADWAEHFMRRAAAFVEAKLAPGGVLIVIEPDWDNKTTQEFIDRFKRPGFRFSEIHQFLLKRENPAQPYQGPRALVFVKAKEERPEAQSLGTSVHAENNVQDLVGGGDVLAYLRKIRQRIADGRISDEKTTALYVGSGADISTALELTDADTFIFVDKIPFDSNLQSLSPGAIRRKVQAYLENKKERNHGFGDDLRSLAIWPFLRAELELVGAELTGEPVRDSRHSGAYAIHFRWRGKERKIIFVGEADGNHVENYAEFLTSGIDYLIIKAGEYEKQKLPFSDVVGLVEARKIANQIILGFLKPGGFYITDARSSSPSDDLLDRRVVEEVGTDEIPQTASFGYGPYDDETRFGAYIYRKNGRVQQSANAASLGEILGNTLGNTNGTDDASHGIQGSSRSGTLVLRREKYLRLQNRGMGLVQEMLSFHLSLSLILGGQTSHPPTSRLAMSITSATRAIKFIFQMISLTAIPLTMRLKAARKAVEMELRLCGENSFFISGLLLYQKLIRLINNSQSVFLEKEIKKHRPLISVSTASSLGAVSFCDPINQLSARELRGLFWDAFTSRKVVPQSQFEVWRQMNDPGKRWVAGVIVLRKINGQWHFLLGKDKSRTPAANGNRYYVPPVGKVEFPMNDRYENRRSAARLWAMGIQNLSDLDPEGKRESAAGAAVRELEEEAGIRIPASRLVGRLDDSRGNTENILCSYFVDVDETADASVPGGTVMSQFQWIPLSVFLDGAQEEAGDRVAEFLSKQDPSGELMLGIKRNVIPNLHKLLRQILEGSLKLASTPGNGSPIPDSEIQWIQQAAKLRKQGKVREALQVIRASVIAFPQSAKCWTEYAQILRVTYQYDEALEKAEQAFRLAPDDVHIRVVLAQILRQMSRFAEALVHIEKAIELSPDDLESHGIRARTLSHMGRFVEALEETDRAIRLDGGNLQNYLGKVRIYLRMNSPAEAIDLLASAHVRELGHERDVRYHFLKGEAFRRAGHYEEAKGQVAIMKEMGVRGDLALVLETKILIDEGQYQEALALLEQVMERRFESLEYRALRAVVLFRLERRAEANQVLNHLINTVKKWPYFTDDEDVLGAFVLLLKTFPKDQTVHLVNYLKRKSRQSPHSYAAYVLRRAQASSLGSSAPPALREQWKDPDLGIFSISLGKWKRHLLPLILKHAGPVSGKTFLEIGFGSGRVMEWLKSQGARVTGVEVETALVRRARQKGFEIVQSNLVRMPSALRGRKFQVTYSQLCLDCLFRSPSENDRKKSTRLSRKKRIRFLRSMALLTQPGGLSIHRTELPVSFTPEEMRKAGFEILEINDSGTLLVLRKRESRSQAKGTASSLGKPKPVLADVAWLETEKISPQHENGALKTVRWAQHEAIILKDDGDLTVVRMAQDPRVMRTRARDGSIKQIVITRSQPTSEPQKVIDCLNFIHSDGKNNASLIKIERLGDTSLEVSPFQMVSEPDLGLVFLYDQKDRWLYGFDTQTEQLILHERIGKKEVPAFSQFGLDREKSELVFLSRPSSGQLILSRYLLTRFPESESFWLEFSRRQSDFLFSVLAYEQGRKTGVIKRHLEEFIRGLLSKQGEDAEVYPLIRLFRPLLKVMRHFELRDFIKTHWKLDLDIPDFLGERSETLRRELTWEFGEDRTLSERRKVFDQVVDWVRHTGNQKFQQVVFTLLNEVKPKEFPDQVLNRKKDEIKSEKVQKENDRNTLIQLEQTSSEEIRDPWKSPDFRWGTYRAFDSGSEDEVKLNANFLWDPEGHRMDVTREPAAEDGNDENEDETEDWEDEARVNHHVLCMPDKSLLATHFGFARSNPLTLAEPFRVLFHESSGHLVIYDDRIHLLTVFAQGPSGYRLRAAFSDLIPARSLREHGRENFYLAEDMKTGELLLVEVGERLTATVHRLRLRKIQKEDRWEAEKTRQYMESGMWEELFREQPKDTKAVETILEKIMLRVFERADLSRYPDEEKEITKFLAIMGINAIYQSLGIPEVLKTESIPFHLRRIYLASLRQFVDPKERERYYRQTREQIKLVRNAQFRDSVLPVLDQAKNTVDSEFSEGQGARSLGAQTADGELPDTLDLFQQTLKGFRDEWERADYWNPDSKENLEGLARRILGLKIQVLGYQTVNQELELTSLAKLLEEEITALLHEVETGQALAAKTDEVREFSKKLTQVSRAKLEELIGQMEVWHEALPLELQPGKNQDPRWEKILGEFHTLLRSAKKRMPLQSVDPFLAASVHGAYLGMNIDVPKSFFGNIQRHAEALYALLDRKTETVRTRYSSLSENLQFRMGKSGFTIGQCFSLAQNLRAFLQDIKNDPAVLLQASAKKAFTVSKRDLQDLKRLLPDPWVLGVRVEGEAQDQRVIAIQGLGDKFYAAKGAAGTFVNHLQPQEILQFENPGPFLEEMKRRWKDGWRVLVAAEKPFQELTPFDANQIKILRLDALELKSGGASLGRKVERKRLNANDVVWRGGPGIFQLDTSTGEIGQPGQGRNSLPAVLQETLSFYCSLSFFSAFVGQNSHPTIPIAKISIPMNTFPFKDIFQKISLTIMALRDKLNDAINPLAIRLLRLFENNFFISFLHLPWKDNSLYTNNQLLFSDNEPILTRPFLGASAASLGQDYHQSREEIEIIRHQEYLMGGKGERGLSAEERKLSRPEKLSRALVLLEEAIGRFPKNPAFREKKAIVLAKLERAEEALHVLEEALTLFPDNVYLHYQKMRMLGLSNQWERMRQAVEIFVGVLRNKDNPLRDPVTLRKLLDLLENRFFPRQVYLRLADYLDEFPHRDNPQAAFLAGLARSQHIPGSSLGQEAILETLNSDLAKNAFRAHQSILQKSQPHSPSRLFWFELETLRGKKKYFVIGVLDDQDHFYVHTREPELGGFVDLDRRDRVLTYRDIRDFFASAGPAWRVLVLPEAASGKALSPQDVRAIHPGMIGKHGVILDDGRPQTPMTSMEFVMQKIFPGSWGAIKRWQTENRRVLIQGLGWEPWGERKRWLIVEPNSPGLAWFLRLHGDHVVVVSSNPYVQRAFTHQVPSSLDKDFMMLDQRKEGSLELVTGALADAQVQKFLDTQNPFDYQVILGANSHQLLKRLEQALPWKEPDDGGWYLGVLGGEGARAAEQTRRKVEEMMIHPQAERELFAMTRVMAPGAAFPDQFGWTAAFIYSKSRQDSKKEQAPNPAQPYGDLEQVRKEIQTFGYLLGQLEPEKMLSLIEKIRIFQREFRDYWHQPGRDPESLEMKEVDDLLEILEEYATQAEWIHSAVASPGHPHFELKEPEKQSKIEQVIRAHFDKRIRIPAMALVSVKGRLEQMEELLSQAFPGELFPVTEKHAVLMEMLDQMGSKSSAPYRNLIVLKKAFEDYLDEVKELARARTAPDELKEALGMTLKELDEDEGKTLDDLMPKEIFMQFGEEENIYVLIGLEDPDQNIYPTTPAPIVFGNMFDRKAKIMLKSREHVRELIEKGWQIFMLPLGILPEEVQENPDVVKVLALQAPQASSLGQSNPISAEARLIVARDWAGKILFLPGESEHAIRALLKQMGVLGIPKSAALRLLAQSIHQKSTHRRLFQAA